MSSAHNRWIISDHDFHEHLTFESAEAELIRLTGKYKGRKFRIYRIKNVAAEPPDDQRSVADQICEIVSRKIENGAFDAVTGRHFGHVKPKKVSA